MHALFPMPEELKRRAWECAFDVMQAGERAPIGVRLHAELIVSCGPERIEWRTARVAFRLHRNLFPMRT